MSVLFEPTEIKGVRLENRFVRSATWEGMATEEGACTPRLSDLMVGLAEGGVGLIITSHAYASKDGQASPWQLGIHEDKLIPGLREMVGAVHERGGKIFAQIAHGGVLANPQLSGLDPMGPSKVEDLVPHDHREMSVEEIQKVIGAFGLAASRAKEAGFDGVQIHAAHGYLLSQFLSPAFNRRKDLYGGRLENRARALMEVYERVRGVVGEDFPVMVKMNCQDYLDGGLSLEESVRVAEMLSGVGVDGIEVSGGTLLSGKFIPSRLGISSQDKEAYFQDAAKAFKGEVAVPILLVGGIRSYEVAKRLVEEGIADYISMSRPLIREPGIVKRWKAGDTRRAGCISDSKCRTAGLAGEGVHCVVKEGKE